MLVIEDRVIHAILDRLIEPDRPYRFETMEIETVAVVLARYLARTVRRSAVHQADIVDTHDTVLSRDTPVYPAARDPVSRDRHSACHLGGEDRTWILPGPDC